MRKEKVLSKVMILGKRIYLRNLKVEDISQEYISWLNDCQINKFLSIRDEFQTYKTVRCYIESFEGRRDKLLLGIFLKENNQHIGNVTLSHIDWKNDFAVIGICIGNKTSWKRGYGEEALDCIKKFVFEELKLNRLEAGVCKDNIASIKLFKKVGFKIEGRLREREKINDRYIDGLIMGLVKREYV
jgi:RimJ/RimL family protein N-acetyltransferase